MKRKTEPDKAIQAPWASTYGLLVALHESTPFAMSPLAPTGQEVVAKTFNKGAGRDVPREDVATEQTSTETP